MRTDTTILSFLCIAFTSFLTGVAVGSPDERIDILCAFLSVLVLIIYLFILTIILIYLSSGKKPNV